MREDKRRYFIELHLNDAHELPRNREAEVRRAQASHFIGMVSQWLQTEALNDKVASMAVTALGQVLITCEQDVIGKIREDDTLNIAAIRPSVPLSESLHRVGGW